MIGRFHFRSTSSKRNRLYPRPMLDEHFNHVQRFPLDGVCESPILLLLTRFVLRQQFHEAVESGFNSGTGGTLRNQ